MAESTLSSSAQSSGRFRLRPIPVIIGLVVLALVVGGVIDILNLLSGQPSLIGNVGDAVLKFLFYPNSRMDPSNVVVCRTNSACSTIHAFVYSAVLLLVVITGFAYTTLLERRFIAWFQHRVGPNRVGPKGLLQPLADAIKLITKEDIVPAGASKVVWFLAPAIKVVPVLIVLAVIPLGPDIMVPWFDGKWYQVPLSLADLNVGILWLLGITSIGTYGLVLAGWASNNKYAMLGGMRSSAQMISYELSLGLTMAVPVMIVGSMSLGDIVYGQTMIWDWYIFQNPLAAGILFIALLAEVSRAPFDLPEAEQELTAGFMTEYSGMKFALFMMAEYLGMIIISMILASLYLGGFQDGFGLVKNVPILGPLVLIGKVVLLLIFMIWIRATLPRIRYDRLMHFGWKILLPLALVAVCWTAVSLVIGDTFRSTIAYAVASGLVFAVVAAGGVIYLRRIGRTEGGDLDDLANDPIVTGERRGLGWGILNTVGALLAVPFGLLDFGVTQLEKIARIAEDQQPAPQLKAGAPAGPALPSQQAPAPPKVATVKVAPALAAEAPAPASVKPAAPPAPKPAAEAGPAASGGKPKFDKEAMLAKIREKKAKSQ